MKTSADLHTIVQSEPRLRQLYTVLNRVQTRLRMQEAISFAPLAMTLGLGAALLLTLVWRFDRMMPLWAVLGVGAGLVLAATLTTFLYARLKRRDLMSTARQADRLLSLDERLSTALEDAARPPANP